MTWPADWMPCLQLAGVLALETALMVGIATAVERSVRSALWHRLLWQTTLLGLCLALALETSGVARDFAGWTWRHLPFRSAQPVATARLAEPDRIPSPPTPAQLTADFRQRVAGQLALNRRLDSRPGQKRMAPQAPEQRVVPRPDTAELEGPAEPYLQGHSMPWPELIWTIGALAALGPIWLARLLFAALHRRRRVVHDNALLDRAVSLSGRMGMRRSIRLLQDDRLRGPVAFGVLRRTVVLPADFSKTFPPAEQDAILAHELAHLAGHDPAWQALADLAAALLWWHPLAWWARSRLRHAAEAAADEASLLVADGPGVLAECLVRLASQASQPTSPAWLGMAAGNFRSGLGRRVQRLMGLKHGQWKPLHPSHSVLAKIITPVALVAAGALSTGWVNPEYSWKGDSMKSIGQVWKRSVATLALFAAVGTEQGHSQVSSTAALPAEPPAQPAPAAESTPPENSQLNAATLLQDARLLQEAGKLDEAEAKVKEALKISPTSKKAMRLLSLIQQTRTEQELRKRFGAGEGVLSAVPAPAGDAKAIPPIAEAGPEEGAEAPDKVAPEANLAQRYKLDPRLAARYGLLRATPPQSNAVDRYKMDPALAARYGLLPKPEPQGDQAVPAPTQEQPRLDPRLAARYGLRLPPAAPAAVASAEQPPTEEPLPADTFSEGVAPQNAGRYGARYSRYGTPVPPPPGRTSRSKQQIEAKLNQITLNDLLYDGLPLSEIVRDLNDQALKRDPDKKGINFLISNLPEGPARDRAMASGQVPQSALADVPIRLHLRNVSLKDILDAMIRITEPPIRYAIEDYGIVFSPGPAPMAERSPGALGTLAEPPRLQVRTFRVDTNTFLAGLENAFGVSVARTKQPVPSKVVEETKQRVTGAEAELKRIEKLHAAGSISQQELDNAKAAVAAAQQQVSQAQADIAVPKSAAPSSRDVQQALRHLLDALGITVDGNKAVFYNDLTGILMVRATEGDLELVQAAIETLGGRALGPGGAGELQRAAQMVPY